jgi:hypothetical protein
LADQGRADGAPGGTGLIAMHGPAKTIGFAALGVVFLGAVGLWLTRGPAIVTDLWAVICL